MRCGLRTELAMPHEILALGLGSERLRHEDLHFEAVTHIEHAALLDNIVLERQRYDAGRVEVHFQLGE